MGRITGLLGLVIAVAIGWYIYKNHFESGATGGAPPQQTIDVVGVRNDLMAIAQAERMFLASTGTYGSIEQLQQAGHLTWSGTRRRGYVYRAELYGAQGFRIYAEPDDPAKQGWPILSVDQNMQVEQRWPEASSP
jgi:hypothetical protein